MAIHASRVAEPGLSGMAGNGNRDTDKERRAFFSGARANPRSEVSLARLGWPRSFVKVNCRRSSCVMESGQRHSNHPCDMADVSSQTGEV